MDAGVPPESPPALRREAAVLFVERNFVTHHVPQVRPPIWVPCLILTINTSPASLQHLGEEESDPVVYGGAGPGLKNFLQNDYGDVVEKVSEDYFDGKVLEIVGMDGKMPVLVGSIHHILAVARDMGKKTLFVPVDNLEEDIALTWSTAGNYGIEKVIRCIML